MNQFIILFCFLFFTAAPAQNFAKDTVHLNEVLINKQIRKPKIKKIKIGRNAKANCVSNNLFFNEDPVFYLTDSLPEGYIQEINLYFLSTSIDNDFERFKTDKVIKTEFEITLYEVGDNYSIGEKINNEPIKIILEGGDSNTVVLKKIKTNLASYNFKTSRFYIYLNKITETNCEECYYYTPALYNTADKYLYISDKRKDIYKIIQDCHHCFGLQMEVKTLTQDY